ncbi:MAG: fibronectin type III domain-containing protein [Actinomycetota bacterium]
MRRVLAVIASVAMVATALAFSTQAAQAAAPGTPAVDGVVLSPSSGSLNGGFSLTPATPAAACAGPGTDGYQAAGFIVPANEDPAIITIGSFFGPDAPAIGLLDGSANGIYFGAPASAAPGNLVPPPSGGQVVGTVAPIADGEYFIGVACTLNGEIDTYWASLITVTGGNYAEGARSQAPTLDSVLAAEGECSASWTAGASDPADVDYSVLVDGTPALTGETGTSATVSGLTNGVTVSITIVANNGVGDSDASNAIDCTPGIPAPSVLCSTGSSAGELVIDWVDNSTAGATDFDVTVAPADAPDQLGVVGTTATFGGLTAGVAYTFTVQPNYAAGVGGAGTVQCSPNAAQVIIQTVEVERPAGALILTQRCGVNNDQVAPAAVDAFPGYPLDVADSVATLDQVGTSPDADLVTPGQQDDAEFANYPVPSPATYPTNCGLDMGTATLVTSGTLAGQYFGASGVGNEITIVDTRQVDAGWNLQATMADFSDGGGNTFSGCFAGITPQVTDDSDPLGNGYDQIVTATAGVLPGTGSPGDAGPGLCDGTILASANAGEGLGIATVDFIVRLLIPLSVDPSTYNAELEFTMV